MISLQIYNLYINGLEIISSHMSNMPNKMLWHTKHIAYIPMVQKSSVCTWQTCQIECYCNLNIYTLYPVVLKRSVCTCQTCQIKLVGVGHWFSWEVTYPTRLRQGMSALVGDPDPYPQVFQFQNAIIGSVRVSATR